MADVIERRGIEPPLIGEVTGLDDGAVYLRSMHDARHEIPWDRVRDVRSDRTLLGLPEHLERAEELWRARSRVERGDFELAEPILIRQFERYRGSTNETALVVAEGLLRCRLVRGANAAAVIPALETARLLDAGVSTQSYAMLEPVVDPTSLLCTELPPVWIDSRDLEKLLRDLAEYDAHDEIVDAMARLYLIAAERRLGVDQASDAQARAAGEHDHPGVRLLARLVAATDPDADLRERSRRQLQKDLENAPLWSTAWIHYGLGGSLIRESGVGRQQRGVVHLLHLPARFARRQPYLAGVALADAAAAVERHGNRAAAHTLRTQLNRSFPNHPIHERDDRTAADRRSSAEANDRARTAARAGRSLNQRDVEQEC
jgi:hypothetical protein